VFKARALTVGLIVGILSLSGGASLAIAGGTGGGQGGSSGGASCNPAQWQIVNSTNEIGSPSKNYANCAPQESQAGTNGELKAAGAQTCLDDTATRTNYPIIWYLGYGGTSTPDGTGPGDIQNNPLITSFRGTQVGETYAVHMIQATPTAEIVALGNGAYSDAQANEIKTYAINFLKAHDTTASPIIVVCSDDNSAGLRLGHGGNPGGSPNVCPSRGSGVNAYADNGGTAIPGNDSAAKAGALCYDRDPSISITSTSSHTDKTSRQSTTTQETRLVAAPSTVTRQFDTAVWGTDMYPDSVVGTAYGTPNSTHPGPTPFGPGYIWGSKISAWGYLLAGVVPACPSAAKVAGARATTSSEGHAVVNLTPQEQQAEGEGGIWNVVDSGSSEGLVETQKYQQEQTRTKTISGNHIIRTTTTIETITITSYTFSLPSSQWRPQGMGSMNTSNSTSSYPSTLVTTIPGSGSSVSYSDWRDSGKPSAEGHCVSSRQASIMGAETIKTFQIITSHANPTGFDRATSGANLNAILPQTDSRYSDAAVTNSYQYYSALPFGWLTGDRSGLFDKLAAYSGSTQSGSSQDSYTFFRDGNYHRVALPFWDLSYSDGVSRNPSQLAPISTAISVWSYSSPQPQVTESNGGTQQCLYPNTGYSDCGLFSLNENLGDSTSGPPGDEQSAVNAPTAPGPTLFGADSSGSPASPTAFDGVSSYSYADSGEVAGSPSLMGSSIWASNSDEPVVLSGYQLWQPLLPLDAPTTNIGFGGPGGSQTYSDGIVETPWPGIVWATHAATNAASSVISSNNKTGFGVVAGSTGSQEFSNSAAPVDSMDCLGPSSNPFQSTGPCDFNPTVKKLDDSGAGTGYIGLTSAASKQNPLWTSINFVRSTGE
jgi:hypothetical protein